MSSRQAISAGFVPSQFHCCPASHHFGPALNVGIQLNQGNVIRRRAPAIICLSTAIYGYPTAEATEIAVREVRRFLAENKLPEKVVFVTLDEASRRLNKQELSH